MALTLTCEKIVKDAESGRVYVRWNDGIELEFSSVAKAREWIEDLHDQNVRHLARKILLSSWLTRDPTDNPANVVGRSIVIDLTAVQPVRVI